MNVRGSTPSSIRYAIGGRLGFLSKCQTRKNQNTGPTQPEDIPELFCLFSPLQYCMTVSMAHFFSLSQWRRCEAAASLLCHKYTSRKLSSRNSAIKCHSAFKNQSMCMFHLIESKKLFALSMSQLKFFSQSVCVCAFVFVVLCELAYSHLDVARHIIYPGGRALL